MHGEKVGFGIVTQLCLDDEFDVDEKYAIVDFEIADRPARDVCRSEPGGRVAGAAAGARRCLRGRGVAVPQPSVSVTAADVVDAMIAADALGRLAGAN